MAAPTIVSAANSLVREARALHTAAGRREAGAFLGEGVRLVSDALDLGARPLRFYVERERLERTTAGRALTARLDASRIVEVSGPAARALGDAETFQGIAATFPLEVADPGEPAGPILLLLDGVQDPGNAGTLLRSAAAAGLTRLVAVRGGADPFGPKSVRAAAAALFALRIARLTDGTIDRLLGGRRLVVADAHGAQLYDRFDWTEPTVLVVGSEARGPGDDLLQRADARVQIPLAPGIDSLNVGVAASILLFEAARQHRHHI